MLLDAFGLFEVVLILLGDPVGEGLFSSSSSSSSSDRQPFFVVVSPSLPVIFLLFDF